MKPKLPSSLQVIGRAVIDWWDGWMDLLPVILFWIFAQVTIVFGPPATFGLYYVVYNLISGQSLGIRGMIEGGRKYFGASWRWNGLNVLILALLVFNFMFYGQFEADWHYYLQGIFLILTILWIMTQFYALPFFFEQVEARVWPAVRNGLFMTLAAPLFSLILAIFGTLVLTLSTIIILPIFLSIPVIVPFMGARAVQNRLVAFGLREREKTPKELEREESSRIRFPENLDVADEKRKVKK